MLKEDSNNEYNENENESNDLIHIHLFHKHVPTFISYPLILLLVAGVSFLFFDYKYSESGQVVIVNGYKNKEELVYGSWPILENKEFYSEVKNDFINKNKDSLKYSEIARNTLKKNKSITIRIAERDLQKIKAKAAEQGLPYQTLLTSMIHKNIYS